MLTDAHPEVLAFPCPRLPSRLVEARSGTILGPQFQKYLHIKFGGQRVGFSGPVDPGILPTLNALLSMGIPREIMYRQDKRFTLVLAGPLTLNPNIKNASKQD